MEDSMAASGLRRGNLYVALALAGWIFAIGFLTLFEGGYVEMAIAVMLIAAILIVLVRG